MSYKTFLVLISVTTTFAAPVAFGSELDSEINDLQVKIVHIKPQTNRKTVARSQQPVSPKIYSYSAPPVHRASTKSQFVPTSTVVASNDLTPPPARQVAPSHRVDVTERPDNAQNPPDTEISTQANQPSSPTRKIFRRLELMPVFVMSSFDGADTQYVIPGGTSNQWQSNFGAQLRTDIDFGNPQFFAEAGIIFTQMGSGTGYNNNFSFGQGTVMSDKVSLTYVGVPLNLKWVFSGEDNSSIYVKAGGIPTYLVGHAYSTTSGLNNEFRFGGYNNFDVLFDGGVGYDYKFSKDFHAIGEVSIFQGIMPAVTTFNVYNFGLMAGIGVAYTL